ncbi:MAG TPA: TetR/AcrR family transcriptional regulator [Acidimicrobiales bacterium]|nr:TetR/AcrR family transcriptional regulator [Acidimicrobiales bacterium]
MNATTTVRPGRQRSEAADEAIMEATLSLLAEHGYVGLTMAAVIERSGVSSATLYRRYTTKTELVIAAVASLFPEPVDTDTGSLHGDLSVFIRHVAQSIERRNERAVQALRLEKERNPELDATLRERFLAPRLTELKAILTRAKQRGEIDTIPPAEVALSLVTGPLYHRAYHLDEPLSPGFVKSTIAFAVRALRA